jgi:transmembrane sensor
LVVVFIAVILLYDQAFHGFHNTAAKKEVSEITTHFGSKSKVQLPDGSAVWLNAGSSLTYGKDYGKDFREVNLSGEGYFDVTRNPDKPFIIHTSNINIKVLGTLFNVKAYPGDKMTETSLIRGSIEVTIKNRPNDKIILSPNEKLVVDNGTTQQETAKTPYPVLKSGREQRFSVGNTLISLDKLKVNPTDSSLYETEWTRNRLVFRDETLDDVFIRMERWYNVTIILNDKSIGSLHYSGSFETETIYQALDALKESLTFKYEQIGNSIIIHL